MGVIFTTNDYQSLEFDVSSERDVYEEFFISIAFYTVSFVQAPLPGFEDKATRIFHLRHIRMFQVSAVFAILTVSLRQVRRVMSILWKRE